MDLHATGARVRHALMRTRPPTAHAWPSSPNPALPTPHSPPDLHHLIEGQRLGVAPQVVVQCVVADEGLHWAGLGACTQRAIEGPAVQSHGWCARRPSSAGFKTGVDSLKAAAQQMAGLPGTCRTGDLAERRSQMCGRPAWSRNDGSRVRMHREASTAAAQRSRQGAHGNAEAATTQMHH